MPNTNTNTQVRDIRTGYPLLWGEYESALPSVAG